MEEKLVCPICGEPTFVYYGNPRKDRLCSKHGKELKEGLIYLCPDCQTYHKKDTVCPKKVVETKKEINSTTIYRNTDNKCIICEESTKNGWKYLCKECYIKCLDFTKELDKNYKVYQYRDYYYNLKAKIYKLTGFENFIKPNTIKLVAIAKACSRYAHDEELLNIVEKDIIEIIKKKKGKDIIEQSNEREVIEFNVKKNQGEIRGTDGHFLDSDKEKEIDNLLFQLAIPHAIHYQVAEITERAVIADWYIPVLSDRGIYVEYFGMDNNDYLKNRKEKEELYEKYKLKLIRIEKFETSDTQRLRVHIRQEHKRLKDEIFDEEKNKH